MALNCMQLAPLLQLSVDKKNDRKEMLPLRHSNNLVVVFLFLWVTLGGACLNPEPNIFFLSDYFLSVHMDHFSPSVISSFLC